MTETQRWRRARDVFLALMDQPPEERSRLLDAVEDDALRPAVEALLAADKATGGLLDRPLAVDLEPGPAELPLPLAAPLVEPLHPGMVLGAYRVVRELGRGGSGSVYVAERTDGAFEQRVAIKVLHGAFDAEALDRFRRERQILASLEHPNIARLIDGGSTPDGRPYVVLEFVDGAPITEHCNRHRLSVRERLKLLLEVCDAVAVSHRNLVVHRDLKPSNVLVTTSGDVKLLDFGIAKLLEGSALLTDGPQPRTRGRWLSPGYASPEQVLGQAISTASDVYSLGVLIYEVLTDRRPPSVLPVDLERLPSHAEPVPPSVMVGASSDAASPDAVAADRSCTAAQLVRQLRGDLDSITLRALRLEPSRRYGSAERLADDLLRFLEGRTVAARRASVPYRVGKFARRHARWVATAGALAFLVLSFAVAAGLQSIRLARERDVARLERQKAESVSAMLVELFELMDPLSGDRHVEGRKTVLDRGTERVLDRFDDQPRLRASLMTEIAGIYRRLAFYPEAEDLLRQAMESRRQGSGDDAPALADTLEELGRVLRESGGDGARELLGEALLIRRQHFGNDHLAVASALASLATVLRQDSAFVEAEALLREAVAIDERSGYAEMVAAAERLTELAVVIGAQSRRDEARPLFERALAMAQAQLGTRHLVVADILNKTGVIDMNAGHPAEAEAPLREALDIRLDLLGPDHPMVAAGYNNLAGILTYRGRYADAEPLFRRALALDLERLGERHGWTAQDRYNLGLALWNLGRLEESEDQLRKSLDVRREVFGSEHQDVQTTLMQLAIVVGDGGRTEEAEALLQEALALLEARPENELWRQGDALVAMARVALSAGRMATARQRAEQALSIFDRQLFEPDAWLRARAQSILGTTLAASGEVERAEELLLEGHRTLVEQQSAASRFTRDAAERLARFYASQGRDAEAETYRSN